MDERRWLGGLRKEVLDFGTATLAGLILASMGPFGTYLAGPIETRIAYWVGLFWCSLLFYLPATSGARWIAGRFHIPDAVALGGTFAFAALPMSALTSFVAAQVWGAGGGYSAPLVWCPALENFLAVFLSSNMIGVPGGRLPDMHSAECGAAAAFE